MFLTRFIMFIWFCSTKSCCCDSSLLEDMCATCFCRYTLVSVNCVKADLSDTESCANLATASLRIFSYSTFPANSCCWAVLYCISFWIMYSLSKRKRNLLKVFWIDGRLIHSLYAYLYFPLVSTKVSAAFINCSAVNTVPSANSNVDTIQSAKT